MTGSSTGWATLVPFPPLKKERKTFQRFHLAFDVVQSASQALNTADSTVQDQISKSQRSLKFMTPAGSFFELWDLPRLHPGRSIGSLPLENEGFLGSPPVQRKY